MLQNEIDAFAQDGVVVLRGFFKEWIELLEKGVENNEQHPGQWFRDYTPGQTEGRFWADYCNWQKIQEFEKFIKVSYSLMQSLVHMWLNLIMA